MFKILILSTVVLVGLSACSVSPARGSKVVFKDGTTIQSGSGGNGNFCPPGQAKKGNC